MTFHIDSDSWTFSKATSEQIQELLKSMKPIKPPVMAPSLEDRVRMLEESVGRLIEERKTWE